MRFEAGKSVGRLRAGGGEIIKKETDEIEDCGRFEDYGIFFPGREFLRVFRHLRFFSLARAASSCGSKLQTLPELALAQLAAGFVPAW